MVRILKFDRGGEKGAYRVITHIHSVASDGEASPLYSTVAFGISQVLGEDRIESVKWRECLIEASDLETLLLGNGSAQADLVCLTDHVSLRSHTFTQSNLALARRWSNVVLGAEVSTVLFARGKWRRAPEVLLYGPARLRLDDHTNEVHYGLVQNDLDKLYQTCVPEGAPEAEINAVIEFAEEHGYAWALAHPLDANELTAEELLPILVRAKAIEVLNGGFSNRSYDLLSGFVQFHNWFVATKPRLTTSTILELNDLQYQLVRLLDGKDSFIIPLGGSDAHVRNLDRVITWFSPPLEHKHRPLAEAFLAALRNPNECQDCFVPRGKGATTGQTFYEAMKVIFTVIGENRELFKGARLGKAVAVGAALATERIAAYFLRQRLLVERMSSLNFDVLTNAISESQQHWTTFKSRLKHFVRG